MSDKAPLLQVCDLSLSFDTDAGPLNAVRSVSFNVRESETLALVGESGCGKSVTCHAILGLTAANGSVRGSVLFEGRNLLDGADAGLEAVRGRAIAMIFQEPLSALNPLHTVGAQIAESLRLHRGMNKALARKETLALLDRVGISDASRRYREYPHQLSGGMNQRAMIAMALACRPKLLIADEPTTALDVTIQAQILELLKELQREFAMALLLITHDLGVVAEVADYVAVMYAGAIVEQAPVQDLFRSPAHPYTAGLQAALPRLDASASELTPIEGVVPSLLALPPGCSFAPRCARAKPRCVESLPSLQEPQPERQVVCYFPLAQAPAAT